MRMRVTACRACGNALKRASCWWRVFELELSEEEEDEEEEESAEDEEEKSEEDQDDGSDGDFDPSPRAGDIGIYADPGNNDVVGVEQQFVVEGITERKQWVFYDDEQLRWWNADKECWYDEDGFEVDEMEYIGRRMMGRWRSWRWRWSCRRCAYAPLWEGTR
jgi:hypothetical protein